MLAALVGAWNPAHAQNSFPSSADPALVPRQVQPEPEAPQPQGPIIERPREVIQAPPGADQIRFVLNKVEIDGSTVYTPEQLRQFYQSYLGTEVSLLTIYQIAEAIGAKYGEDGYILSLAAVPAQRIRDGEVRIQVIEGYVDKIVVEGDAIKDSDRIKRIAQKITTFRPLKNDDLERYLLLINDIPGVSARGVLKPSATPGASDLVLVGERKRFDGYTSADNRGTRYVGPYQFQLVVGASPSESGLLLMPLTMGVVVGATSSGRFMVKTGRYKAMPLSGLVVSTVIFLYLGQAEAGMSRGLMIACFTILGVGLGLVIPPMLVAVQNAVEKRDLGTATSAVTFFRSMGGSFGVAVLGAIIVGALGYHMNAAAIPGADQLGAQILRDGRGALDSLPEAARVQATAAAARAFHPMFQACAAVCAITFFVVLFLKEIPLRSAQRPTEDGTAK